MLKNLLKKEKGFTLIEIVLVMAIAGLILVIVFLAVQGAQRSRRDTQRRGDASRYLAAAEQFASNNQGNYPDTEAEVDAVATDYLLVNSGRFADPSTGANYTTTRQEGGDPAVGNMFASEDSQCNGRTSADATGNRIFAVVVHQESGISYCVDNR